MFTADGRFNDGIGDGGLDRRVDLHILDECGSEHTTGGADGSIGIGYILHQGYDGAGMFCYPAGDSDGEPDTDGSDY